MKKLTKAQRRNKYLEAAEAFEKGKNHRAGICYQLTYYQKMDGYGEQPNLPPCPEALLFTTTKDFKNPSWNWNTYPDDESRVIALLFAAEMCR